LINSIVRDKISKKYGFVLKTKELEDLLLINGININIHLWYTVEFISTQSIFDAHFPLLYNNTYNQLNIFAGALSKEHIPIAREKMREIVLPEFKNWIMNISALPNNSTYLYQKLYFNAFFRNDIITIEKM
jgi:hypothetical protein